MLSKNNIVISSPRLGGINTVKNQAGYVKEVKPNQTFLPDTTVGSSNHPVLVEQGSSAEMEAVGLLVHALLNIYHITLGMTNTFLVILHFPCISTYRY